MHELTVPKTPEQNGVAEWMNRILVEMTHSMLSESKLPLKFWAEALVMAADLRNRCPAEALKGTTCYEAFTGEKPNLNNLCRFGCIAFAHVPKNKRKKLDSKARKCILLRYGPRTKGYWLYDPKSKQVIHSRDEVFNEEESAKKNCEKSGN